LAGQSEFFLSYLRQPGHKFLRVIPAQVGDWSVVLSTGNIRARFRRNALVPLANGYREFTDSKWFDCHTMNRLLRKIIVTAHRERAAGNGYHRRHSGGRDRNRRRLSWWGI